MTTIETSETIDLNDRGRLPDPDSAPAIAGLQARPYRDRTDYARLAELQIAANEFDGIPYLPTASRPSGQPASSAWSARSRSTRSGAPSIRPGAGAVSGRG